MTYLHKRKNLRILVDHGSSYNLGDTAMIEGVVSRLLEILPQAELFVIHRQTLRTKIWYFSGVSKVNQYSIRPFLLNIFGDIPFFWRLNHIWREICYKLTLQCIGNVISPGSLPLHNHKKTENGRQTLGKFCEKYDALHVVGGGNLTDTFYNELLNKCCLIQAFTELGKPVILTGQQLGPFRSKIARKALEKALRKVNFVGLREPMTSVTFCQKARLDPKRFEVMGDDSFGLPSAEDSIILNMLAGYGIKAGKFLALNVRIGSYVSESRSYLKQVATIMDKLASKLQMPILIVPIALNPDDSDISSGKELAKLSRSSQVLVLEYDNLTPSIVKGILGKAYGAVGASYHFCTFALTNGVPAVCIYAGDYYAQKARGLCEFWKDKRLALPLKNINIELAAYHIAQVFKDEVLREKLNRLSQQALERWQYVFDKRVKNSFAGSTK